MKEERNLALEIEISRWLDKNDWLIPDDGGVQCYGCDCWKDDEGCVYHLKGKDCIII